MTYTSDYSHDEIFDMTAGRELDAAIASTFFGWRWMKYSASKSKSNRVEMLAGLFPPEAPLRFQAVAEITLAWQPSDRYADRHTSPVGNEYRIRRGGNYMPNQSWDTHIWVDNEEYMTGFPYYSGNMTDAWLVVELFRDMWTKATENISGFNDDFPRPFDDGYFFECLQRHADRRHPWALLYLTPEVICKTALFVFASGFSAD